MRQTETGQPWLQSAMAAAAFAAALASAWLCLFASGLPTEPRIAAIALALAVTGIGIVALHARGRRLATALEAAAVDNRRLTDTVTLALNEASDKASGWLWETDMTGHITHASRGLALGLGLAGASLRGRSFAGLFDNGEGGAGWHRLLLAMEAGQAIECAVELPLHGSRTWWQITAQPLKDATGRAEGYRGIARDITAERVARHRLAEERDQACRNGAQKSQFLSMMGQELRAPLNTLVGFSELLLSPQAVNLSDGERREHLLTMLDSSRHLQGTIADVLDMTRIEMDKLQLVEQEADAAEIVEVAMKMCRDAALATGTTIIASVIDGIELRCDVNRIKQVVINLVTHAVNASAASGTVRLEFDKQGDGGLIIAVADSGIGIDPAEHLRIFEPFVYRGRSAAHRIGGLGLGLPIARRIALLHGGDVTIDSVEGAGTIARLILPAARVAWPAEASQDSCAA